MDAAHDLEALAKRVEAAAGPDRDLDCLIAVGAMGFIVEPPKHEGGDVRYCRYDSDGDYVMPGQAGDMLVPRFTGSIDAAMTLAPEGVGQEILTIDLRRANLGNGIVRYKAVLTDTLNGDFWFSQGASFALALAAASLRALSQGVNDDHA